MICAADICLSVWQFRRSRQLARYRQVASLMLCRSRILELPIIFSDSKIFGKQMLSIAFKETHRKAQILKVWWVQAVKVFWWHFIINGIKVSRKLEKCNLFSLNALSAGYMWYNEGQHWHVHAVCGNLRCASIIQDFFQKVFPCYCMYCSVNHCWNIRKFTHIEYCEYWHC